VVRNNLTDLAALIERRTGTDGGHETAVPGLTLFRFSAPTDVSVVVYEPSLCVVAQGAKEVLLADETYRYDPAHSLLVSVDLPVAARVVEAAPGRPFLVARIAIDLAAVVELLADDIVPMRPGRPTRAIGVSPVEPPLLDAVCRLLSLLDSPQEIVPLAPLVLREITYRVLAGPHGSQLRQLAAAGAPAQRIARAIRWLKDNFAEPLRIEALAKHARMSPSALHLHFKHVTALSPLQYQKQLRLQESRRLMMSEGLDAGEAAFRVGYESQSQFSREYRRLFSSPPRQDISALKAEAQLANSSRV
jgi:AraC-like DNA-binding protein